MNAIKYIINNHVCRIHKTGVPHRLASQQKLGPVDNVANDAQLLGRPKHLNDRPEERSNLRPEDLADEERRPLLTPTRFFDRGGAEPLLTAPL